MSMNEEIQKQNESASVLLHKAIAGMKDLASSHGSRELSIAITNAETAALWFGMHFVSASSAQQEKQS